MLTTKRQIDRCATLPDMTRQGCFHGLSDRHACIASTYAQHWGPALCPDSANASGSLIIPVPFQLTIDCDVQNTISCL
jgi:hypothetical protein